MKWTGRQAMESAILKVAQEKRIDFEVVGRKAKFWPTRRPLWSSTPTPQVAVDLDFDASTMDEHAAVLAFLMEQQDR